MPSRFAVLDLDDEPPASLPETPPKKVLPKTLPEKTFYDKPTTAFVQPGSYDISGERVERYTEWPGNYEGQTVPRYGRFSPSNERYTDFGIKFGPVNVAACSTATFQSVPQYPIRLHRLIIPTDVGQHFDICDIRVGNWSACLKPIPAIAFSEFDIGINLGLPDLMAGMILALSVTNKTNEDRIFIAAFIGNAQEF